jgi:hypothetical protein
MLDQLPVLADVQRYMDELAIMDVPEPSQEPLTGGLLVEQVIILSITVTIVAVTAVAAVCN